MHGCICVGTCILVHVWRSEGNLQRVSSLLPLCEFHVSNSDPLAWQQTPSPTESHRPWPLLLAGECVYLHRCHPTLMWDSSFLGLLMWAKVQQLKSWRRGPGVPGHSWLHSEFESSLGYLKSFVKKKVFEGKQAEDKSFPTEKQTWELHENSQDMQSKKGGWRWTGWPACASHRKG